MDARVSNQPDAADRSTSLGQRRRAEASSLLFELAMSLQTRFEQTGRQQDLDWTIALTRLTIDALPRGNTHRWKLLFTLAESRSERYERWRCHADFERAIVLRREAVALCPADHESRCELMTNLAASLRTRYDLQSRVGDLDEAIELQRRVITSLPRDHPDRPESMDRLAVSLLRRFLRVGSADDLRESISLFRTVLSFRPKGHPDHALSLHKLASSLWTRFGQSGSVDDLNESIALHREALSLRPHGHPDRCASLSNLANSLLCRFKESGSMNDLNDAVRLHRDALSLCHHGHPERSIAINNLANSLQTRFGKTGSMDDLNDAIRLHREALSLHPHGHPDRPIFLNNLASGLQTRLDETGSIDDLDEAIRLHRDALSLIPRGHTERSSCLDNLATGLRARFALSGSVDDLDEAIRHHREALDLRPRGHPNRSMFLNNIANGLQSRFEHTRNMDDLNEAIELHREALSLRPRGNPGRSSSLDNLASSLGSRFEKSRNMEDLNEAIRLHREALRLRPHGHPHRSSSLNNLACKLERRFEQTESMDDLDEALRLHRDALTLRPVGHPDRSSTMINIATALHARSRKLDNAEDFEECIRFLMEGTTHPFSPTLTRLSIAERWVKYAQSRNHDTTLTAYRTAISLLQRALTIRPDLSSRHDLLNRNQGYQTLGVDAASYAIEKGDLPTAIELLEHGRALLWSQMRGLRTPLDRLAELDKPLAERFRHVSRQIEALMTESSVLAGGSPKNESRAQRLRDEKLSRVRRLSEEQEALISDIRKVPGFEDFLEGASFERLRRVAAEGPVILVNHSEFRCDALIILPREDGSCVNVPLDEKWFLDAVDLCNDLLEARYERKVHSVEYDEALRRTMKVVWDRVVSKVVAKLDELGIAKGSRIWWCPTRFLSMLPFHAAGPYADANGNARYLLDDYVSSYTPTLTSLIASRSGIRIGSEKFLFVGDTRLPTTKKELDNIRKHRRVGRCLLDEKATPTSVIKSLQKFSWVHFTCHGKLDSQNPFESSFALPGGNLTLLDIARANLPNAEFAFLSACHTAEQRPAFAWDEALHLAAAVQFCGFRSVVGTMWGLLDRDGPVLAEVVYMHMCLVGCVREGEGEGEREGEGEGEVRFKGAAAAVREAALHLRRSRREWSDRGEEEEIMVERWVNLVHIGA